MDRWTNADSAKAVLEWAEKGYTEAVSIHAKRQTEEVGRQAMEKYWNEKDLDNGVGSFGTNPYQERERHSRQINEALNNAVQWKATLDFVRDRICEMIE